MSVCCMRTLTDKLNNNVYTSDIGSVTIYAYKLAQ
jgi:hypothetical protein